MGELGLGLATWDGWYAGDEARWLRWTDANGILIPTGRERAEAEAHRAEAEKRRAESAENRARDLETKLAQYAARLRDAGLSPNGE